MKLYAVQHRRKRTTNTKPSGISGNAMKDKADEMLNKLKEVAINNGNLFEELMETVKYCSLGQITHALYEVGGQYRRNM